MTGAHQLGGHHDPIAPAGAAAMGHSPDTPPRAASARADCRNGANARAAESAAGRLVTREPLTEPFVTLQWRCRKRRTWLFDLPAIRMAAGVLGIERPVALGVVEAGGRQWSTNGTHRVKPMLCPDGEVGPVHAITVRRDCSPRAASRTIWHELAHAKQAEDHGSPEGFYDEAYKRHGVMRTRAYETNPFEVDAREHEALDDQLHLVTLTDRAADVWPPEARWEE